MSKVMELIEESKKNFTGRKTTNNEEYIKILTAVLTDDEYTAKDLAEIKDGELIMVDKKIAPGFRKLVVAAFRKAGMSEEEAQEAAKSFKVTKEMAEAILEAVRETDFLVLSECNKKIKLFKKPGLEVSLVITDAKETVRPNPKKAGEQIKIKARKKVRVCQVTHPFQKEFIFDDKKKK